jgi:hypothetical protein
MFVIIPPHHFVFYPVLLILLAFCMKKYFSHQGNDTEWLMLAALTFMLGWCSFMMRQHYGLINQNRVVRLEMRVRYYELTQKRFGAIEQQLSFGQLAALRFAGDDELLALVDKTLAENLSPAAIKKLIIHWQPDLMRV